MDNKLLLGKIKKKKARIGIIGLGYVGLPLAILFAKKGFSVTGFVRSRQKAEQLNSGKNHIGENAVTASLKKVLKLKTFHAQPLNEKDLSKLDVIIVCVPTPVGKNKKPDITDLQSVAEILKKINLLGKLIINESTVAPFTTRTVFGNLGNDYFLASSPERIDPGNKEYTTETIAKVLGGRDKESIELSENLYNSVLQKKVVSVRSMEAAEMAKMLENTYRAVNIALINEFAKLAEAANIDILEVLAAAKTKWSFHAHYPGIGVGGHCIPVDPYYILDLARSKNVAMPVVLQSLHENETMPLFVAEKVFVEYKKGMKVLIYGIAYKKNVNDFRESPVIIFCDLLKQKNIPFSVYDPYIAEKDFKKYGFKQGKIEKVDILVVGTDHSSLLKDAKKLIDKDTIVIDGRNYFTNKVGKKVMGIGRALV